MEYGKLYLIDRYDDGLAISHPDEARAYYVNQGLFIAYDLEPIATRFPDEWDEDEIEEWDYGQDYFALFYDPFDNSLMEPEEPIDYQFLEPSRGYRGKYLELTKVSI